MPYSSTLLSCLGLPNVSHYVIKPGGIYLYFRSILLCKLTICFFYCSIIGILTYAEYFIIISFCLCHNTTTLPFYNLKKFYEAIFLQLRRILYSSYFSDVNLSDYMNQIKPLCNLRLLHHHLQNFPVPDLLPV